MSQRYQYLDILLVHDGSPDRCGQICDDYAEADPRVRVIHQANAGVSAARNAALAQAKGAFVAFADADDWVEADWIETLYRPFMQDKALDVSVCGWYREESKQTIDCSAQVPERTMTGDQAFCAAVRGGSIEGFLVNKLFRAELLQGLRLREDIAVCEDLLYCCRVFRRCGKVACVPEPLYHYRIREGSALHNVKARLRSEGLAREEILQLAAGDPAREDAAVFTFVQQTMLNALRAKKAGENESAASLRQDLKPYVSRALKAESIPLVDRGKLAMKLIFPNLISEEYI